MPASFLLVIGLFVLLVISVLGAIKVLIEFIVKKEKRKTILQKAAYQSRPIVALFTFFLSIGIYDGIIAELTCSNPNFSDFDKTRLNEHFYICGVASMCVYDYHTDRQLLQCVDSIYLDGNTVIASSRSDFSDSIALYRFDYAQGQCTRELLFTGASVGELWSRYVAETGIDRSQVRDALSVCADNNWWHLLVSFALAVLTSVLSVKGLKKLSRARH